MGSSSPPLVPQGCTQGSWHSTFQELECGHTVQSCPDELLCTRWALQGSSMELTGRFYTFELLPGQSLSSFGAIPLGPALGGGRS